MKNSLINKDVDALTKEDTYSLLMHAIYKATGDDAYATVSELIYALDKDHLLSLCAIFGGVTIKVPTLLDLKIYATALACYQVIYDTDCSFNTAYREMGLAAQYKEDVLKAYSVLKDLLNESD